MFMLISIVSFVLFVVKVAIIVLFGDISISIIPSDGNRG